MENVTTKSIKKAIVATATLGVVIFLSTGSFSFMQGWNFLAIFTMYSLATLTLSRKFLERRLQEEKRTPQKNIQFAFGFIFIALFIVCGLNYRFKWQVVSEDIKTIFQLGVFLGYLIMFLALKNNEYAANNVGVVEGQVVVSSGLYSLVRHPMYLGNIIMVIFLPLALGFYWALALSVELVIIMTARILDEEKLIIAKLPGYSDYCKKVKYRLIPFVW
jgi:protein-S-isoprenylcysteine O-methyltransferase Ste14